MELITSCVASLRRGAVDEVARHARVRAIWPMRLAGQQLRAAHRLVDVGEHAHVLFLQVDAVQRRVGAVEMLDKIGLVGGALAKLPLVKQLICVALDVERVGDRNCRGARNDTWVAHGPPTRTGRQRDCSVAACAGVASGYWRMCGAGIESAQYHLTRKSTVVPLQRAVTPETEAGLRVAYEPAASVTVTQSMEASDHDLDTWLPAKTLSKLVTKPVVLPPVSQLA